MRGGSQQLFLKLRMWAVVADEIETLITGHAAVEADTQAEYWQVPN